MADAISDKEIVMEVLTGVLIRRDPTVVSRYFADDYAQHKTVCRKKCPTELSKANDSDVHETMSEQGVSANQELSQTLNAKVHGLANG